MAQIAMVNSAYKVDVNWVGSGLKYTDTMDNKDKAFDTRKRTLPRRYYTIGEYDLRRRPFVEYLRMWGRGNVSSIIPWKQCDTQNLSHYFPKIVSVGLRNWHSSSHIIYEMKIFVIVLVGSNTVDIDKVNK